MTENTASAVPTSLQAAWGVRERPGFGPRPGLSLDRIVAAALELAESDGLAAVSMVKVAKALDVSTMALYRYVAAKDELLELMLDAGFGEPPPAPEGADWREGLAAWVWDCLTAWRRHPWMLHVPVSGPPLTPHQIAWLERGLTCLADTGLSERERLSVVMMASGLVRGWANVTVGADEGRDPAYYATTLSRLIDPLRFPAVTAAMAAGAIDDDTDDPDEEFRFQLERLLDGVQALITLD